MAAPKKASKPNVANTTAKVAPRVAKAAKPKPRKSKEDKMTMEKLRALSKSIRR